MSRTKTPTGVRLHLVSEQEIAYDAALKLVEQIDTNLTRGVRHYRNRAGMLLTTLDEVVRAILSDDLDIADKMPATREPSAPSELKAAA